LLGLAESLQQQRYVPHPALGFWRRQGQRQAARLIGIATVKDRIVQRYLLQQITPLLEEAFSPCSFAYRSDRSVFKAVDYLLALGEGSSAWVLQTDIHHFFDQLAWPILLTALEQLPLKPHIRHSLQQQICTDIVLGGRRIARSKGVIQGSTLSGALANLYLNSFDQHCLAEGIRLVRYGDDLAAVCATETEAYQTLTHIEHRLKGLYLGLNPHKTIITPPDGPLIFLGHHIQAGQVLGTVKDWRPYRPQRRGTAVANPRPQRPKLCDLNQTRPILPLANPLHSWSDAMTTLYITDQGAMLRVQDNQFQVYHHQELQLAIPASRVSHIILFGCCNLSHAAARLALWRKIPVVFLSQKGNYFGRLETAGQAEVDSLTQQVLKSQDGAFCQAMAATLVRGKLHNSRKVLQRLNYRHHQPIAANAIEELERLMARLEGAISPDSSLEVLRGYEGQGAKLYFAGLGSLFSGPFQFEKRTLRPPKDPINSLLSLGYTLLHQNMYSLVLAAGLHSHFGHLHTPRKGHPALVMDLIEEFRSPIVDSLVAYLINSKIFSEDDFTPPGDRDGVYLFPHGLKRFIKHWEDRMQMETTHPHTGFKVTYRRCLELQVREYTACLMGEQPMYRPMLWDK
jgi:CRISPR-associated endonuclease Cas1